MTAEGRGVRRRLTAWMLLALAAAVTVPLLGRDLWFDEALTLLDFALLPSIPAIWQAYVIPNNQLLHTALLHFWVPVAGALFPFNAGLRLLPLATTLVLVLVLWWLFGPKPVTIHYGSVSPKSKPEPAPGDDLPASEAVIDVEARVVEESEKPSDNDHIGG